VPFLQHKSFEMQQIMCKKEYTWQQNFELAIVCIECMHKKPSALLYFSFFKPKKKEVHICKGYLLEWDASHREVANTTRIKKEPLLYIDLSCLSHIYFHEFHINICTYPSMNLDHEATSIIVIVILYLTIVVEVMLWTNKSFFCV